MLSETTPILHHERHERVPSRADRGVGVIVVVELPLLGLASSVTRGVEVLLNVVPAAAHRRAAAVDDKVAARAKEVLPYYVARAIRVARTKPRKLPAKVMLGGTSLTQDVPQRLGQLPMCCMAGATVRTTGDVLEDIVDSPDLSAGRTLREVRVKSRADTRKALRDPHGCAGDEGWCTVHGACVHIEVRDVMCDDVMM